MQTTFTPVKSAGMELFIPALAVKPDEPCFALSEMNLPARGNGSQTWHRFQNLLVIRGDRLALYTEDLGPRELFKADQFRILGGWFNEETGKGEVVNTVAQLRDRADYMRDEASYGDKFEPEPLQEKLFAYTDDWRNIKQRKELNTRFGTRLPW